MASHKFSQEIEQWLTSKKTKTLNGLIEIFDEKSFAVLLMILMFFPSLPIPTGGVTHFILLPIAMLLGLELLIGRDTIWLPEKVKKRSLGALAEKKVLPFLTKRIQWFERFARPRMQWIFELPGFSRSMGFLVILYALAAFFAPAFSGLDTLPALGVVVMSLGLILEDGLIYIMGIASGIIGIVLAIAFGAAIAAAFQSLFN